MIEMVRPPKEKGGEKNSVGPNDELTFTENLVAKQIMEKCDGGV